MVAARGISMTSRRQYRILPKYGLTALVALLAAAFAAIACGSDSQTSTAPDASAESTQPSAAKATATLTPPKTLLLVQSYDPGGFPEFTLPKVGGGELNSADYIGKQPVAVVFYRGNF